MRNSFVDEYLQIDEFVNKRRKQLVDELNLFLALSQALEDCKPRELTKAEKARIEQQKALKKLAENSYFDNIWEKKKLKKRKK